MSGVRVKVYYDGGLVDTHDTASVKQAFLYCQFKFGHCLGAIKEQDGTRIGWRFARCGSYVGCIPEIYKVILNVEIEENDIRG